MKVVSMTGRKGGNPSLSSRNALILSQLIYNLPSLILLWSNQKNWKGNVRQYPQIARVAIKLYPKHFRAAIAPKCS